MTSFGQRSSPVTSAPFEYLGEEVIGEYHFTLNPAFARVKRYRIRTPEGTRYFTLHLSRNGWLIGVLVEE